MPKNYNYEEIENKVEDLWEELEPKLLKRFAKSLNLVLTMKA
jgi:hypothetical protein